MTDNEGMSAPNNPYELTIRHAVREGAHDGVSNVVQYAVIAGTVALASMLFLNERQRNALKRRFL